MKKFVLLFILISSALQANAASRYITVQEGVPYFYGNIPTNIYVAHTSCDPFMVKIDGTKYYMLFEIGNSNYSYNNLLGCTGASKYDMFTPLRNLERDGDVSRLTGEELKSAGIRFVAQNFDNTLAYNDKTKDFDLNKISYIDMTRLRITPAAVAYGNFDVYVKKDGSNSLKKIIGKVSMMGQPYIRRMF